MSITPGLPRILIVDDSRIVRATIIKRIRDRFAVREEVDGEAGWEALLIDPTLQLVVTDHSMPRLDGYGLIERIRASKVRRIRDIPVIMISGDEDEESRQRAKDLGATDFIAKGTGAAELLARLDSLVNLSRTHEALDEARASAITDAESGLLTPTALLHQAEQVFAFVSRHGGHAGVLSIGLDRFEELVAAEGQATADALVNRFAGVLAGAVRKEDGLARWHASQFAVVTPGIDARHAHLFAERLRSAVAGANIQHGGRALHVTVSVGLASCPADGEQAPDVLAAAERRMAEAMAAGGNCVAGAAVDADSQASVDEALAHLAAGRDAVVKPQLVELGLRLLPLLRLMDHEFHLGLRVADIERRLTTGNEVQVSTTEY
ncbi:MAG TPA: diguanylate cyclase [Rhodocyclaceae bacterium]|nr:diguanylate cyclase [Rhodocyclaceae bacterium]